MNELMKLDDIMSLAEAMIKSQYFKDIKDVAQAVIKIQAGQEIGIGPIASINNLYIQKGRVCMMAVVMSAKVKGSGKYNYKVIEHSEKSCTIEFFENGESVGVSEFFESDAKRAGLLNKDNWKSYPRNMYFSRAISNGARWYCPDLFNGQAVYTPEELDSDEPEFIIENPITNQINEIESPADRSLSEYQNVVMDYVRSLDGSPKEKLELVYEKINDYEFKWPNTLGEITMAKIVEWSNDG